MKWRLYTIGLSLLLFSCKEVEVNEYEINPVEVESGSGNKTQKKSDLQFISILYSDVFGRAINQSELQILSEAYRSFGDQSVIAERMAWQFLSQPDADLPANALLQSNPDSVVTLLYQQYYSRTPGEMELWYAVNWLSQNPDMDVKHLAFALLTSSEYQYY